MSIMLGSTCLCYQQLDNNSLWANLEANWWRREPPITLRLLKASQLNYQQIGGLYELVTSKTQSSLSCLEALRILHHLRQIRKNESTAYKGLFHTPIGYTCVSFFVRKGWPQYFFCYTKYLFLNLHARSLILGSQPWPSPASYYNQCNMSSMSLSNKQCTEDLM